MGKTLLVCMTPVRNEAWVLHAFLRATSLWADYIIIADQLSTDGSREIAMSYPKVILIENNNPDFNEAERQSMLIDRARQIEGDKILFGLDADEIFAANYIHTNDWQHILTSKPGDVFWFKWAELRPDKKSYWEAETTFYPWCFHDDGIEPHGNYAKKMHSMRIPYPIDEKQMYYITEFKVLHLASVNISRVQSKARFYKFIDWEINNRSVVKVNRLYSGERTDCVKPLETNYLYVHDIEGFDIFELIDLTSQSFWFDDYIIDQLSRYDRKKIGKLNIWDQAFLKNNRIKDPRDFLQKCFHFYLFKTVKISRKLMGGITIEVIKK